tara:strand:- start:12247 stop:13962 length:1716 start_codon:yes stop_codon:yes gene_type:complete
MAESVKEVSDQLDQLQKQLEQVGVFSQNTTKTMGLFERQQLKITTALKKSPIYGMAKTLQGYAQSISKVTAITGKNSTMTAEQKESLRGNMTMLEKLTAATIAHGVAQKMSNKLLAISNNGFTRLIVSAFSLVSIFMIVGFALAALSIAFDGANSPVLKMTEDLGPLHDAMQGLVLVISGEGDEGGLSSALDVLAASLFVAGGAALFFSGPIGLVAGAIMLTVGTMRIIQNEFDNIYLTIGVGIGVLLTLIGSIMMVKKVFALMKAGSLIAIKGTAGAVVAGIGFVIGGVAGLVAFAMGAGKGIKGVLLGIISALAIFVGLWIAGVTAAIAAPIALGLLLIAIIIRYWDEIKAFLGKALKFLLKLGGFIFYGLISGLGALIGGLVGLITGAIGLVLGLIAGIINAIFQVGKSFYTDVIKGGGSLIKWFISIPNTIKKGFINGFKAIFNGVTGIYNGFAKKMKFDIPKWVPVVGGKTFKLPTIPKLAKGGVVDSPTLAMIGEDGPEAVVPLNRKNNPRGIGLGGGGGMTVNINVGGVTDRTDKRALAKEIGDLIRAEMTRGGRSHGNRRSSV